MEDQQKRYSKQKLLNLFRPYPIDKIKHLIEMEALFDFIKLVVQGAQMPLSRDIDYKQLYKEIIEDQRKVNLLL
jgi:hypothetical protein